MRHGKSHILPIGFAIGILGLGFVSSALADGKSRYQTIVDQYASGCDCSCADELTPHVKRYSEAAANICATVEDIKKEQGNITLYTNASKAVGYGQKLNGAARTACTIYEKVSGKSKNAPKEVCDKYKNVLNEVNKHFPDGDADPNACSELKQFFGGSNDFVDELAQGCSDWIRGTEKVALAEAEWERLDEIAKGALGQALNNCIKTSYRAKSLAELQAFLSSNSNEGNCGVDLPYRLP